MQNTTTAEPHRDPFERRDYQLNWSKSDIEQRLGFRGGRFTSANKFLTLISGALLTAAFYAVVTLAIRPNEALKWVSENILNEKLLTVENWMEISFHLCKQRWDSSMDWLETQPMSKVLLMVDILQKHVERENSEIKKSSRRK
jgi:hypothetical protein